VVREFLYIPLIEYIIISKRLIILNTYPAILVFINKDPDEKKEIKNKIRLVIKKE
jgi:hypothetical protein